VNCVRRPAGLREEDVVSFDSFYPCILSAKSVVKKFVANGQIPARLFPLCRPLD
jgi:hypothetical protein